MSTPLHKKGWIIPAGEKVFHLFSSSAAVCNSAIKVHFPKWPGDFSAESMPGRCEKCKSILKEHLETLHERAESKIKD